MIRYGRLFFLESRENFFLIFNFQLGFNGKNKIANIKLKYINEQIDLYYLESFLIITEAVALKLYKRVSC